MKVRRRALIGMAPVGIVESLGRIDELVSMELYFYSCCQPLSLYKNSVK
jgi:hypothetical protein